VHSKSWRRSGFFLFYVPHVHDDFSAFLSRTGALGEGFLKAAAWDPKLSSTASV